ncbi:MAG TPA: hydroxyethylthiazole kinase [Candidatus Agrococcus pullicola]|uniref:Hydroxyethylthiazole kinase n=1 Tax=Candidatus Agrococcus pullicola TaxID=2838429 RepID=A0A9D1YUH0_9MICO|nr:hydroxyethylthiazole kinase [Candidatus Agrococcus pullicola]
MIGDNLAHAAAATLERVRSEAPLVHCITNNVVPNFTANALLAAGAAPAMVDIVGESGMFAEIASALLVNLGTPTPEQRGAILEAVEGASRAGTPWVLDPVAIGALPIRTHLAQQLAKRRPTVIRGNPSELLALAGSGTGGRGVDATDSPDAAAAAVDALALRTEAVIAASGEVDLITDGTTRIRVHGGSVLLTKVTGGGCALGSIIGAFVAARGEASVLAATAAAHAFYSVAAERAASESGGPGSFSVRFLDALASVTGEDVAAAGLLSTEPASA